MHSLVKDRKILTLIHIGFQSVIPILMNPVIGVTQYRQERLEFLHLQEFMMMLRQKMYSVLENILAD